MPLFSSFLRFDDVWQTENFELVSLRQIASTQQLYLSLSLHWPGKLIIVTAEREKQGRKRVKEREKLKCKLTTSYFVEFFLVRNL